MGYSLAPAVTFCESSGRRVFLDVARDRYFCLGELADASFARLLAHHHLDATDRARLARLVIDGVLREGGAPPSPCPSPPRPRRSLLDDKAIMSGWAVVVPLLRYAVARLGLRFIGLRRMLAYASQRDKAPCPPSEVERRSRHIASAFQRAALFATIHDHCLAHSIAVAAALRTEGIEADLVLGVHLLPFRAHCWVQQSDVVVNDSVDNVRDFTPILVRR